MVGHYVVSVDKDYRVQKRDYFGLNCYGILFGN